MSALALGIDVGTSATKVVAWSPDDGVVGRGTAAYSVQHGRGGRAEQDPDHWWQAVVVSVRQALGAAGRAGDEVAALCLSTQGGTLVTLDAEWRPNRPAAVWSDTRVVGESPVLAREVGAEYVHQTTGWHLGGALNLLQIRWMRAHQPELFAATRHFLSVPDYLSWRLTGRAGLDASNGGVNQLANYTEARWDEQLMKAAGIDETQLGELIPAGAPVATLTADAAAELGLSTAAVLVNGGHDQLCVALGAGATRAGDTLLGTGTAWVTTVVVDDDDGAPLAPERCGARHVVPGLLAHLLSLESGGSALEWWLRDASPRDGWPDPAPDLDPRSLPLFFPYLQGSPYPHSAGVRGVFWGLEASHNERSGETMAAGVMAGVAMQAVWMLDGLGSGQHGLRVTGGATRSRWWMQTLADVLGAPLHLSAEPEPGALGAALLAARHIQFIDDYPTGNESAMVHPSSRSAAWRERSAEFRRLAAVLMEASREGPST